MRGAAPERHRVLGLLLWAAGALQPHERANLMDFGLGFPERRALHELAQRWLPAPPEPCRRYGQPTGLSALLADACREALNRLGEPEYVRDVEARTKEFTRVAVHTDSPLQGWRIVLQMLVQSPQKGPLVDRDQRPLAPAMQLAAWEDLLRLQPPRSMLALWLPRFSLLHRDHPRLPGIARVAAQLHLLAESPDAERFARDWVVDAQGDPEALLCRMRVGLRQGDIVGARDDAIVAIQAAVDAQDTLAGVLATWREALAGLDGAAAAAAREVIAQFEALPGGAVPATEGRR